MEISEDRIRKWSRLSCVVCTIVTLIFTIQLYQALPKFEQMFKEMELGALPRITEIVFMCHADLILGGIMLFGVLKEFLVKDPIKSLNISFIQMAVVLSLKEVFSYALFVPLIDIMNKIGK